MPRNHRIIARCLPHRLSPARQLGLILANLAIATCLTPVSVAAQTRQDADRVAKQIDPYTGNKEAAMGQAGYASFGPFQWADGHSTIDIRKLMPTEPILFVETAHFKIGSALPGFRMPKSSKRKRALVKELKALKTRIPKVDPKTRKIDRWLRLHLYAHRLEQHYANFQKLLGVTDADFPQEALPLGKSHPMGHGPYLGLRNKFIILLLRKASDQGRYSVKVTGRQAPVDQGFPHYFVKSGCFLMAMNTEIPNAALHKDHEMHCFAIFGASQLMVGGYRGFRHNVPAWLSQGIVQWFSHRLDPEIRSFQPLIDGKPNVRFDPKWKRNVRGMVKHGSHRPLTELMVLEHSSALDFLDIMSSWSRVEFMITKHHKKFREFFRRMNDVLEAEANKPPAFTTVLENQKKVFQGVWKMSAAEFDEQWKRHVLKAYPRR